MFANLICHRIWEQLITTYLCFYESTMYQAHCQVLKFNSHLKQTGFVPSWRALPRKKGMLDATCVHKIQDYTQTTHHSWDLMPKWLPWTTAVPDWGHWSSRELGSHHQAKNCFRNGVQSYTLSANLSMPTTSLLYFQTTWDWTRGS